MSVLAELERHVRESARQAPLARCPFHDYLGECSGVVHVGAHLAQEREVYGDLPVVWIEAATPVYEVLCAQIKDRPRQKALRYLVADGKRHRFGLANNACQSSSIFDFARHKDLWPDVGFVAADEMRSVTLEDLALCGEFDPKTHDALVLDVQGAELLALRGAGELIHSFKFVQAEAADFEAYAGGCTLYDLDAYLSVRGFERVRIHRGKFKEGVGAYYDVLYRNTEKGMTEQQLREECLKQNEAQARIGREVLEAIRETNGRHYKPSDFTPGDGRPEADCECVEEAACGWADMPSDRVALFPPRKGKSALKRCPKCGGTGAARPEAAAPLRLNLGSGAFPLEGFTNLDRKSGQEAYPLPYPDGSAEEIVASHVLEHFSHRDVSAVLQDWVRVLAPGGKVRLAVPDFEEVARLYLAGAAVNVQGYVMGGHSDGDDMHGCLFDREALTELMIECGLERIGPWEDEPTGCAAGPHSLNLQGYKPSSPVTKIKGLRACLSVPRFGPLMHPRCWDRAAYQLGLEGRSTSSCYWAQQISNLMEDAVADPACEVVLTMDFDTVFSAGDVLELYRLLLACPEADAVIPLQSKRSCDEVLMSLPGRTPGTCRASVSEADLARNLLPANTGHFGLTMFRADSLRRMPRPWMVPAPNAQGLWRDGHVDADIDFWGRFKQAGLNAFLAPKVVVGHLEEVIKWPGKDLKGVYQTCGEYEEVGIPAAVRR